MGLYPSSLAVDGAGNVYSVGAFRGNADIDPGPGTGGLLPSNASNYIAKYDAMGAFLWSMALECPYYHSERTLGATLDAQGDLLVTGIYSSAADFDPGAGTLQIPMTGPLEGNFVLKLSGTGQLLWAVGTGMNEGRYHAKEICTDPMGNVYTVGSFRDSADFDPGPGIAKLVSTKGNDMFVRKQDANGNFLWARSVGSDYGYSNSDIAADVAGNVYFSGVLQDTSDLDPGPGVFMYNVPVYTTNSFLEKLDDAGNMVEVLTFGDLMPGMNRMYGIGRDPLGALLVTGDFNKPCDFDPGSGVAPLAPQWIDSYVLRLHTCPGTDSTMALPICDSVSVNGITYHAPGNYLQQLPNASGCDSVLRIALIGQQSDSLLVRTGCNAVEINGQSYSSSGTYVQTLPNQAGCDSVLTLQLTVLQVDTAVSVGATSLSANASGAAYQWLDCGNGMAPIPGATSQSFSPSSSGIYAVAVTQNGCSDTSRCIAMTIVGLDLANGKSTATVHPNPSDARFLVEFDRTQSKIEFTLRSLTGQTIQHKVLWDFQSFEILIPGAAGVYFLDLRDDQGNARQYKLIKRS
jgi:hypothetical protein